MSIARGVTPTFKLTFAEEELDLTTARNVYVTFTSGSRKITKTGESLNMSAKEIDVFLTQTETLSFHVGDVEIQANWLTSTGVRVASEIIKYPITRQLLDKEIQ